MRFHDSYKSYQEIYRVVIEKLQPRCLNYVMPNQKASSADRRQTIWVLGGGRFGQLAARRLRPLQPAAVIYVVEKRPQALSDIHEIAGIEVISADAVEFIFHRLATMDVADWIVPAVPVHVEYQWVLRSLSRTGTIIPLNLYERLRSQLFNPMQGTGVAIYTSIADFRCPDDCAEPADRCTITGKSRPAVMFRHLQNLHVPGMAIRVIRSHQLAPGVGGYPVSALSETLVWAKAQNAPMLLATACQCHGVLHAFQFHLHRSPGR